ncbi:CPBP family intramembrane metalloprotease [Staphylococcus sp. SQ8-PEA]|uniref:CPBP family intramembrane metalloprotease n=1 Tax=Staphylococcus marylandisciuri TaxID=2981529 RepID=A0ABT2QQB1_9STAP|nr:type II CAAX endopeptidase family protein [Staphylococcus marylandisciuri]MCU5746167.1 CPBP family intramembrane metalloprotease [Staphylococcus marylandisciuri]
MSRILVSILTIVIYLLAQFGPMIIKSLGFLDNNNAQATVSMSLYIQVIGFIIAAILIIFLNYFIKNPLKLERPPREEKRYVILWAVVGYVFVMVMQMIVNLINVKLLGGPQSSPNTEKLMMIARKFPIFIILISCVGPMLEEYVFRKVIFGEIYNLFSSQYKKLAFIIAAIVSSSIFSVAHSDPSHFLTYFFMGIILAGFYVYTKRIWVSIFIHMAMNASVVIMQVVIGPEKIKQMTESTSFILNFIFH